MYNKHLYRAANVSQSHMHLSHVTATNVWGWSENYLKHLIGFSSFMGLVQTKPANLSVYQWQNSR